MRGPMMEADPTFPQPALTLTAAAIAAGQPLPLRLSVTNPWPEPLVGATAELTIEVEKGVLLSWQLALATVPADSVCADAVTATDPEFQLPSAVEAGLGQAQVVLFSADGSQLNEAWLEVPVVGAG